LSNVKSRRLQRRAAVTLPPGAEVGGTTAVI
jgi:hypothetical protein